MTCHRSRPKSSHVRCRPTWTGSCHGHPSRAAVSFASFRTSLSVTPSGAFVLVVPELRLPQLDLVFVGVHDPRELPVLVRFGPLNDSNAGRAQLLQQRGEIVDAVVDHEGRV